eukprot:TRINITY_DN702_c0_g2_i5.p1 TRINITY_DN702_c0_g2~~TRINITY_DN702_c0_g2_i5.p1  ORF type:complete len:136 (-),score=31.54 TRINITY_DN702_c0_g2_i5:177-584(-)
MVLLGVNGTLMRGLGLNKNMHDAGAVFLREDKTAPVYRLWTVDDKYPGMLHVNSDDKTGASIDLEVWEVDAAGLVSILSKEPPGLSIGNVQLQDGTWIFGVLAEPYAVQNKREITSLGGWRNYIATLNQQPPAGH